MDGQSGLACFDPLQSGKTALKIQAEDIQSLSRNGQGSAPPGARVEVPAFL